MRVEVTPAGDRNGRALVSLYEETGATAFANVFVTPTDTGFVLQIDSGEAEWTLCQYDELEDPGRIVERVMIEVKRP